MHHYGLSSSHESSLRGRPVTAGPNCYGNPVSVPQHVQSLFTNDLNLRAAALSFVTTSPPADGAGGNETLVNASLSGGW